MHKIKTHPIIKTKGKVELNPELITLIKVQAPRDIIGNRKYQLNLEGYLAQGIIPLDLVHSFDKTQVKWNITEKEAYAIYKSVKKFAFYITGAKTMVFSDHKPLKNFFEGGMNITKLDRWSLELQEFDISIVFIQGKLNTVADIISHLKNEGLYKEHSVEDHKIKVTTDLNDRIEDVLDIALKPLNFRKLFSTSTVISRRELLSSQKRDKWCRKLAKLTGKYSDYALNHEGLLTKQINILRNTY